MARKLINDKANGLHVVQDNLPELLATIRLLTAKEVLVGVPGETTERDDALSQAEGITNASIAYIQDNGAPEQRIPARPFMLPGMKNAQSKTTDLLAKAAKYTLQGRGAGKLDEGLNQVGFTVVNAITTVIRNGIAPALAERTLQDRARRGRKGAQKELDRRARGLMPSIGLATPLMDTGELLKSITYVIRPRRQRSK